MFIFAAAFQQDTETMCPPAGDAASVAAPPTPSSNDKPKKKFQVVPVPGEFTRGRWKVIDTRFGSAMGEFGNYPPDDEYKMIVSCKNNVITVRKKFHRPPPPPAPADGAEGADSIRVLQKSQPRFEQHASVHPTNQISIVIMDPETTASITESGRTSVAETVSTDVVVNNNDELATMTNPSSRSGSTVALVGEAGKLEDPAKLATATSNTVVAIDNKIVQAMDLVKTHLTFAVREEVETLRTTITDLEARLNALREENRLLRENVAPDVLAFITANKQICE